MTSGRTFPDGRRQALKLLGASALALPLGALARQSGTAGAGRGDTRPNIIFIMTDDQQQSAMSAYGNEILKTPNMDRIANEGIRFEQAFVTNSLCAPSRASFLTGLYSHAHGIITNGEESGFFDQPGLSASLPSFPSVLQRAGYHTAVIGKWHLHNEPHGADHWSILDGQGQYFDPEFIVNGGRAKFRGHVSDVIGDQALAYLQHRPKDRPFCLLYQFKAPHRSWEAAPRFSSVFEDVEIPEPRTFEDRLEGRPDAVRRADNAIADMPDFRDRGVPADLPREERKRANLQALVKNYYRTLLGVDENVGRVLDFLEDNGLSENTIVVYTSDNGFFLGEHGLFDKRLMYEASIKVPMLLRWPARIAPRVDREHMVLNIDVAPTLIDLAGATVPASMHGASWRPLLDGDLDAGESWRDAFLYEYYEYPAAHCVHKNRGVRTDRWKLIHFWEQPEAWELYDLENDPDETRNLANDPAYADTLKQLRDRLLELRREVDDEHWEEPDFIVDTETCKDR